MNVERFSGRRVFLGSAVAGAIGLLLTAIGFFTAPAEALTSYLLAFCYWAGLSAAALILLAAFHATHAAWVVVLRRSVETMASSSWALPVLFLPIAFGLKHLYPWVEPAAGLPEHELHLLEHKAAYLNVPFFLVRAAVYFGVWIAVAELLRRWSLRQDGAPGDERLTVKQRRLSAGALPFLAVTITFAAFDWLMTLEPSWFSTVFGVYYFAGSFLGAIAVLTLATALFPSPDLPGGLAGPPHLQNLGKLMFGFVCFWAYIAYSQFMLIWIANLPEEVPWYLARITGSWRPLGIFLFLGHFALPFLALLPMSLKLRRGYLVGVALWLLAAHFVDLYWLVVPSLHHAAPTIRWTDFTAFAGVGGVMVALALHRLRGRHAVPVGDPYLATSLRYTQP